MNGPTTATTPAEIVTIFDHAYDRTNPGHRAASEVFDLIRSGALADGVAIIQAVQTDNVTDSAVLAEQLAAVRAIIPPYPPEERAAFDSARAKYLADPHNPVLREGIVGWLKKALPCVIFAGKFWGRSGVHLQQHSGLIVIDLDDVPNPAATVALIGADPHCRAAFVSPTGTGVKIVLRVPPTDKDGHKQSAFPSAKKYLEQKYGVTVDDGGDVNRLCFMSADSALVSNPNATPLPVEVVETAPVQPAKGYGPPLTPGEDYNARGDVPALMRKHGWTSSDEASWTRPGKDSGVSATLGVCEGPPNCLWVFSTNAPPFEPEKRYEPFNIFTLLEARGDAALATEKLQKMGYGPAGADSFLILPSPLGLTFSESAAKIFGRIGPTLTLFSRGRVVHEIIVDEYGARLEPIAARAFRSRLEKHGKLMVWRADRDGRRKLSPALCAEETASGLLATTEAREILPSIRAMINAPTLALDGEQVVTLGHGWNPQNGGVFVTGHLNPPTVELHEAVAALFEIIADYDFQSEGDRSRALACLITPTLKNGGLLKASTPVEAVEADASQAGKGHFMKLTAAIYDETPSLVAQREGVGTFDEQVSRALLAGRPFIQFDNLRGKVASTYLEAVLTAEGPVPCRVPYQPAVEVDVRPFTFTLTSNGVEATRDLANRCSFIRIRKRPPGYQFRVYPEGTLLEHVAANQAYYLGCVFAVVRQWLAAGRPRSQESRHDFRVWAQTLDWIVQHALGAAPLMDGHEAARDRVADVVRSWLRSVALLVTTKDLLARELSASELAELCAENDLALPSCRPDASEEDRARAVGRAMAKVFANGGETEVDGLSVTRRLVYSPTAAKDVPRYLFAPL